MTNQLSMHKFGMQIELKIFLTGVCINLLFLEKYIPKALSWKVNYNKKKKIILPLL